MVDVILFAANVLKPEYGNVIIFDVLETFPATASPTSLVNTVPTIAPADSAPSGFLEDNLIAVAGGAGAVALCLLVAIVVCTCRCMCKTPVRGIPVGKPLPASFAVWGDV